MKGYLPNWFRIASASQSAQCRPVDANQVPVQIFTKAGDLVFTKAGRLSASGTSCTVVFCGEAYAAERVGRSWRCRLPTAPGEALSRAE